MSSIVVAGDVSGSVTIAAPSAAGSTTLTLPSTSGTIITTASSTGISGSAISSGTVAVAYGGTGTNSATAYAVQCGGTTSTGAHQSVASVGTAGQVLTSNGAGALPTFQTISSGGMTLLGTLTTTSGTAQTLSGLTLTNYKFLQITIQNVSFTNAASLTKEPNGILITRDTGLAAYSLWGIILVDLSTGTFSTAVSPNTLTSGEISGSGTVTAGKVNWSTATTSLQFGTDGGGSFDSGTIKVYGVA